MKQKMHQGIFNKEISIKFELKASLVILWYVIKVMDSFIVFINYVLGFYIARIANFAIFY